MVLRIIQGGEEKMKQGESFARKAVRIVLIVISITLVCTLILVGALLVYSPGRPAPFLDENGKELAGSISEKIHVKISGVDQGMFLRGRDKTNPVLLFLHGGPGMPEYFLDEDYPTGLEDSFTVCWWEQRGAGLSYDPDVSYGNIKAEQLVLDTLAVSNYLRERFGQQKIYLLGHSWGTFIGIQAAERAPGLYHAYIGMSQISQQFESEKLAYKYVLEQFKAAGNKKMVRKLEEYDVAEYDAALTSYLYSSLRDEAMHRLGVGTMHNMKSVVTGIFLPVMECRAYTLGEKINLWRGKAFLANSTSLRNQMYSTDLAAAVPKLDLPVYFMSGLYDYTVSYTKAKDYFESLQAPVKGFYTFGQSAHSPLFEEPEKFLRILREDVLTGTTGLSDGE